MFNSNFLLLVNLSVINVYTCLTCIYLILSSYCSSLNCFSSSGNPRFRPLVPDSLTLMKNTHENHSKSAKQMIIASSPQLFNDQFKKFNSKDSKRLVILFAFEQTVRCNNLCSYSNISTQSDEFQRLFQSLTGDIREI